MKHDLMLIKLAKKFVLLIFQLISLQAEQFTVLWVLFTVIVVGNLAVLFTLYLNKNRKSRMNFFIKHLAITGKLNFNYKSFENIRKIWKIFTNKLEN
jgi:hypothetical protein